jgi:riboflavin biosynthesis pyrimidine reductase
VGCKWAGLSIIAHGGASFARSLVAQGLVDQYDLLVQPVALGKGLPVFSDLGVPRPLKLMRGYSGGHRWFENWSEQRAAHHERVRECQSLARWLRLLRGDPVFKMSVAAEERY